jgi:hypothetical protein
MIALILFLAAMVSFGTKHPIIGTVCLLAIPVAFG